MSKAGCVSFSLIDKALLPVIKLVDNLTIDPSAPIKREDVIRNCQETVQLGLAAHVQRCSVQRRVMLKNAINPKYVILCEPSADIPVEKFLFGEDLATKAKNTETTVELSNKLEPSSGNFSVKSGGQFSIANQRRIKKFRAGGGTAAESRNSYIYLTKELTKVNSVHY